MEFRRKVLIVDDEFEMLENCARILNRLGHDACTCQDSQTAVDKIKSEKPDVVITDLKMPKKDGISLVREIKVIDPQLPVIVITGFASIESAVEAVKAGAFDYIAKPFTLDQFKLTLDHAFNQLQLLEENRSLKAQLQEAYRFNHIVGVSPAIQEVFEAVRKVAKSDANILILGESGTGKELVARSLHSSSSRTGHSFVAVDCVSLPDQLLESELFGYEKGAFTGAVNAKPGLIELAQSGTLFLDEIGELGIGLQAKLLRVLQERQFRRVGGTRLINVDMWVIAATNRDLGQMVKEGTFREDLYYRLNVICINLPPLREREGDIPLLAHYFCEKFGARQNRKLDIPHEVMQALEGWTWPGNIRELRNVLERAVTLADGGRLSLKDLPSQMMAPNPARKLDYNIEIPFSEAKQAWVDSFERGYLTELLQRHGWNISQAANEAGIDRRTIHRLINKHGIGGRGKSPNPD